MEEKEEKPKLELELELEPKLNKVEQIRYALRLEHKKLLDKVKNKAKKDKKQSLLEKQELPPIEIPEHYKLVTTREELDMMVKEMMDSNLIAVDTETTGLDFTEDYIVGASCYCGKNAYYVPVHHSHSIFPRQVAESAFYSAFRTFLEDSRITTIWHNFRFDYKMFRAKGVEVKGKVYDTLIAQHILNENEPTMQLKVLAKKYLRIDCDTFSNLFGDDADFREVPHDWAFYYGAKDSEITYKLWQFQYEALQQPTRLSLHQVLFDIEFPLMYVTADMEFNGIRIDTEALEPIRNEVQRGIEEITEDFKKEALAYYKKTHKDIEDYTTVKNTIDGINFNSSSQMQKLIYDTLEIKPLRAFGRTIKKEAIKKLSENYPFISLITERSELNKLLTSFILVLPDYQKKDGRIHSNFNQVGTKTARYSSSSCNMQQIPSHGKYANLIRGVFIPRNGYKIFDADFSNIEWRIVAALANEDILIDSFKAGVDLHKKNTSIALHKPVEEVTKDERNIIGKTLGFATLYGMSISSIAKKMNCKKSEAQDIYDNLMGGYPKLKKFIEESQQDAMMKGYVETYHGRRRRLPEARSMDEYIRSTALRQAVNARVQSSAGEVLKKAMVNLRPVLKKWKCYLLLTIHDELVIEVPEEYAYAESDCIKEIIYEMEHAVELPVPIVADFDITDKWQKG